MAELPRGLVLGRAGQDYTPAGRACALLLHPVRRFAVEHAIRTGQVTALDIRREFVYLEMAANVVYLLKPAVQAGLLRLQPRQRGTDNLHVFTPGDVSDLRALRDLLVELLGLPEVPQ